jgi:valyl-tRNA synthetase
MSSNSFVPKIKEKTWSAKLEKEILSLWEKENLYTFNPDPSKPVYSIDTPPPYVNTPIHIGQAYTYTWMDAIARYKRLLGFNVLFPIGLDRNGLPIEVQTEKEYHIRMFSMSRQEFIDKAKKLLDEAGNTSISILKELGHSYNNWNISYSLGGSYRTDDPEYRRLTQDTFIQLYRKGLIYEAEKTTNYCPACRTVLSDAEVEYKQSNTSLNFIKFKTTDGEELVIATTRPELLPACKLVIYNPEDERYKHLNGKEVFVPLFDFKVKILEHPAAKREFGTGLVMICSFGDYTDIRILRELNIQPTYVINQDGKMNSESGKYEGLTIKEARAKIIEDLKDNNLLIKTEEVVHEEPICWRSKNPIEFISMNEIYLKQIQFKDELISIVDQMKFYDPQSKNLLIDWIRSISVDWVISRRRYYGTEIPLWYCEKCGESILPEPGKYYIPWKEPPPVHQCPKCGNSEFKGETRIFDTWFDSSSSEQYILGYLWNADFFEKNFPCSLRPQGKEIVRSWLYFTLLKSYLLFGKPPFKDIWINYHIVDEKGEKMSKSLGNIISPRQIIDKYGAEVFRIWTFTEGNILTGDVRYSNERAEGAGKFLTKLWNLGRFISSFPIVEQADLTPSEEWILSEMTSVLNGVLNAVENYNMNAVALSLRNFTWKIFADHYVELVKPRAYGAGNITKQSQEAAWFGLHFTFKNILILLSPLVPFITDYFWRSIYANQSIHATKMPILNFKSKYLELTESLIAFNSKVWNEKKARGLSLKDKINIDIPDELNPFKPDLVLMHNIG